jgi:hypothetical protein
VLQLLDTPGCSGRRNCGVYHEWALKAQQGFGTEDRALDAFMLFDEQKT